MPSRRPFVLAIDTSGSFCSVAISDGNAVVVAKTSEGEGNHFERLPDLVSAVFEEVGISADNCGQLRIGLGPGSFTGLRIGLGFAKGFVAAEKIPLVGLSSFHACALATYRQLDNAGKRQPIGVFSDARRGEVFWALYAHTEGRGVVEIRGPEIVSANKVREWREQTPGSVCATPVGGFCVPDVNDVIVQDHIGIGLLESTVTDMPKASADMWAMVEPHYIRPVAAKTIEERRRD